MQRVAGDTESGPQPQEFPAGGELKEIMEIPVLKGEIVIPSRRKGVSKGGKKK